MVVILGALVLANLKMIVRDRQALFWALAFPLIFMVIFGLFDVGEASNIPIAVIDNSQDDLSRRLVGSLEEMETFEVEMWEDEEAARRALRDGDMGYLLIIPAGLTQMVAAGSPTIFTFVYDEGRPMSAVVNGVIQRFLDQVNLELVQAPSLLRLEGQGILATQPDYFDFLLPGLLGMGVMVYSIIGVASVMALYREKKILKRILATPLRVRTFFAALIIAYLLLSLVQAAVILTAGVVLFGGQVLGNLLHIGIIVLMANAVFLNIGFIVGSFSKTVPAASGLGNAVAMPMMFLSGTFFPKDGLPDALAAAVEFLPLSPMLDALRGVALEARPLWDFPLELALLGGWLVVTAMAAIRLTRFS